MEPNSLSYSNINSIIEEKHPVLAATPTDGADELSFVEIQLKNGETYKGSLFNGLMHGNGEIHYKDGRVLIAEFLEGEPSGRICINYPNGSIYDADVTSFKEVENGLPNGYGALHIQRRTVKVSTRTKTQKPESNNEEAMRIKKFFEWCNLKKKSLKKNKPFQFSKIILGYFKDGKPVDGRAEITTISFEKENRIEYLGPIKKGKPHGYGKVTYCRDGKVYYAHFKEGRLMSKIDVR